MTIEKVDYHATVYPEVDRGINYTPVTIRIERLEPDHGHRATANMSGGRYTAADLRAIAKAVTICEAITDFGGCPTTDLGDPHHNLRDAPDA